MSNYTEQSTGYKVTDQEAKKGNITYFDMFNSANGTVHVKKEDANNDKIALYKAALLNSDSYTYWAALAANLYAENPNSFWDHAGKGFSKDFLQGHYCDLIKIFSDTSKKDKEKSEGAKSTGLVFTNNLKNVQDTAHQMLADIINRRAKKSDFEKYNKIQELDDDTKRNVFYQLAVMRDQYGGTQKFGYNAFGIVYYDFDIEAVVPDNGYATPIDGMTEEEVKGNTSGENWSYTNISQKRNIDTDKCMNKSSIPITQTVTLTESTESSISNTIASETSTKFESTQGIEAEIKFKFKKVGLSIWPSLSFTEGTTETKSESNTTTTTSTVTKSSTTEINEPPHTVTHITQESGMEKITINYDAPVIVTYKVGIFSMCGSVYTDAAAIHDFRSYEQRTFWCGFGNSSCKSITTATNAVEDLRDRTKSSHINTVGYDASLNEVKGLKYDGKSWANSIDWSKVLTSKVFKESKTSTTALSKCATGKDIVEFLSFKIPMSPSGAVITNRAKTVNTVIENPIPLYELKAIRIKQPGVDHYSLKVFDELNLDNIELKAYDFEQCEYYGFNQMDGTWVFCGSDMKEINHTDIAIIDSSSSATKLIAKNCGTVYLKYKIPENKYKTANGVIATNHSITTVRIKITVNE